jgi:hypothetical protein
MDLKSVWLVLVVSVVAVNQVVHAQDTSRSRIVKELEGKGFSKCAADLDRVVKWVQDGEKYAHVTVWNQTAPNQRTAFAITSERYADGSMVTTYTASPDMSGNCSISSAQVFTSTKNCPSLRDDTFKQWKFLLDMGATAAYERDDEKSATVLLTPTPGGGCIVLKQTSFYY